ncbi:MAG: metallophosphoesterase [Elusimicrobiaceae bacterium]|nr:metallophosphoesterase [Elusimicrobiaceae bacterium]MBP5616248.1 metallophosphoesterase [Elusimicrobiaceae bacterium]
MQKNARKLVAVGDVHGQFEGLVKVLRHAGLIDAQQNWCGGHNRLVQIGDILDRGPFSLKVDALLDKIQLQAEADGGEVIRLVGNHELEIMMENYLISEFQREQAVQVREKLIGQVLSGDLKAAYAYKDFLFTHAGVTHKLYKIFQLQLEKASPANLAVLINLIFKESIKHSFFKHPIFNISLSRKGPDRFGGIFWEDLEDLVSSYPKGSPVWQIFGHTPVENLVVDRVMNMIALDVGLAHKLQYLEISEQGIPTVVNA